MSELTYTWKMPGLAKKVDPGEAANELHRLQDIYGRLTPEIIVKESENKDALLHNIFEWDNSKAAYNYRIQQARILLNNIKVTIISDGEPKEIDVYEVTSISERYKSIDTFTDEDVEYVKAGILKSLKQLKDKLKTYKEFDKVVFYIDQAINEVA
jgi:hypothetical protein